MMMSTKTRSITRTVKAAHVPLNHDTVNHDATMQTSGQGYYHLLTMVVIWIQMTQM